MVLTIRGELLEKDFINVKVENKRDLVKIAEVLGVPVVESSKEVFTFDPEKRIKFVLSKIPKGEEIEEKEARGECKHLRQYIDGVGCVKEGLIRNECFDGRWGKDKCPYYEPKGDEITKRR